MAAYLSVHVLLSPLVHLCVCVEALEAELLCPEESKEY